MVGRRTVLAGIGATGTALILGGTAPAHAAGPAFTLTGPVTGGRRGGAFGAYLGDISAKGYVEEEYFLTGTATRFRAVGEHTADGKWAVQPAGTSPYATRILVRRPKNSAKFNGTVILEWANVSSGLEISFADPQGVYEGFAYVSVSAQRVGIHGFSEQPRGLIQWDPDRYGKLSIPGDSLSYDIFTQAARAVGPGRPRRGRDPMGGLKVRKLIATGGSQSAGRLFAYINAIQPRERLFDAFVPVTAFGLGAGFEDAVQDVARISSLTSAQAMRLRGRSTRIREDMATPVMVVNSETETLAYYPVRQPDTARYRYWEVTGASHAPTGQMKLINDKLQRDGLPSLGTSEYRASDVMWLPVVDAALRHVQRWITDGTPPPTQPLIEVAGQSPMIVLDEHGNAKGGVRLPEVVVPIARYKGRRAERDLAGLTEPFAPEKIKALYPTHADYVAKVTAAAKAAEQAGVILPYKTAEYVRQAEAAAVPPA